jgi:hypothetical protein
MSVAGARCALATSPHIHDRIFTVDQQKALSPKGGRFFYCQIKNKFLLYSFA